jgi:uncharacterized protein YndB with AHSA1/START domain
MRYLLIAAAILGALVLLIVVIGWSLPVKHQATSEITINASPGALYKLITDVERYPKWRSSVKRTERLPDSAGRTRFREIGSDGTILYEMETAEPNKRVVNRIADSSLQFGGSWTYELIPRGDSTTLRITENGEVYNPIFRFVSRFVMGHTRTIKTYLHDVSMHFDSAAGAKLPQQRK